AAMHALSSCAHPPPLENLVAVLVAHRGPVFSDPGTHLWRLRSTDVVQLLLQRWSSPASDRDRARVESLLASMDPDFVDNVLAALRAPAAANALHALPRWDHLGFQPSRRIRDRDKARAASEDSIRKYRARLGAATVADLERLLDNGIDDERAVAVEL